MDELRRGRSGRRVRALAAVVCAWAAAALVGAGGSAAAPVRSGAHGGGAATASSPANTPTTTGLAITLSGEWRTDFWGIRTDGVLVQRTYDAHTGAWQAWVAPIGGGFRSVPGVVASPGRWDVFAVGTDGRAYQQFWNGHWQAGTYGLGGGPFQGGLAVTRDNSRYDVWGVRTDGVLLQRTWLAGSGWGPWVAPIGGGLKGTPAVVETATEDLHGAVTSRRFDVFAVGTNGQAYQQFWNGHWQAGTYPLGDGPFLGGLGATLISGQAAQYAIFGVRTDGVVRERTWGPDSGWGAWTAPIGAGFEGTPAVLGDNGAVLFAAVGTDGQAYEQQGSGSSWWPASRPLRGGPFAAR